MWFFMIKNYKNKNSRNLNIIILFLLLTLTIIFFSSNVFSKSVCCVDYNSPLLCINESESSSNYDFFISNCNVINDSEDFIKGCFDIPSENYVGAAECNLPNIIGYCCGEGTSFYNESDCTAGEFVKYEGQSYSDACNIQGEECNLDDLNFNVEAVKGESKFKINWNVCTGGRSTLEKNDEILVDNEEVTNSYIDTVEWGRKTYTYKITVVYNDKTVSDEITVVSGDEVCEGKISNDPFCSSSVVVNGLEEKNAGGFCDSNNQYNIIQSCGDQLCKISLNENNEKIVVCAYTDSCESKNVNFYNSTLNKEFCETIQEGEYRGDSAYCFYDNKSYSLQGYCYSCSDNCFSYKSESSCNNDPCGIGTCEWKSIIGSVNGGVCIDTQKNNCELLSDVEKNSGVSSIAYSEILQPIFSSGDYSYENVFSNSNYICNSLEGNCYEVYSCLDYNEEECNSNVCLDVDCGWNVDLNKCVRVKVEDNVKKSVCNGDVECEKDWFSPKSKVEFDSKNNLFKITSLEDKKDRFSYYEPVSLNEIDFFACIVLEGKTQCDSKDDFKKVDSREFGLKDIITEEEFNNIKGKSSVLKYYSVDKYFNEEEIKSLNFKTGSYSEYKPEILLLKPEYSAVLEGEKSSFIIQTNFDSDNCKYNVLSSNIDEKSVEYNKDFKKYNNNIFSSSEEYLFDEDKYLYIKCDYNNGFFYETFKINAMNIVTPVISNVYAQPNVLFSQNSEGNYETKIHVESDKEVFCKYSLEELEEYDFNSMNYFFGYDKNFNYKDFSKIKDYTLIIPNSFIRQEFNVTVKCIDKVKTQSNFVKVKVKITDNPNFDDWIQILSPKSVYYNNKTVNFTLKTFVKNSYCSMIVDKASTVNLERQENNIFNTSINFVEGSHEVKYVCYYIYKKGDEEKKHLDEKSFSFIVDSTPPNVSFSIIGDSYDSGRPIVYSKILKLENNISDEGSGVLNVNYIIYTDDGNKIVSRGILNNEENVEIKNLNLENNKVYTLKIIASDYAGNIGEKEESFKTDFSIFCSNNIFDSEYETDVDCGLSCSSCSVGKSCNVDSDCNEGLICDEVYNKCYSNTCYNNVKDGDEEGIDCGGSCVECKKDLVLVYPKFGVSSKEEFDVLVNSSKSMVCNYKFDNEDFKVLDDSAKKEHYIYNVKIKNNDKKRLYLNCTDGEKYYSETFVLKVDVEKPKILSFEVNPKVNNVMTNKNGILSYWNELNVITDKNTVCKFNIDSSGSKNKYYSFKGIFDKGNENNSRDYIINHNVWIPTNKSKHDIYVVCKALNSLESDVYVRSVDNNPYSNVSIIILNPVFGRVYSSTILAVIDSTVNSNYCKYSIDGFENKILDRKEGNIFSSEFKIINSELHNFVAVCNFNKYDVEGNIIGEYNVTLKKSFVSDLDKPKINSVIIEDPYNNDNKILSDNSLKIVLDYDEKNVYSFIFKVYVNEEEVLQKTFFGRHEEFFINNLNLSDDDKVKVKVKIVDIKGNFEEGESNYLTVKLKEYDKKLLGEKCSFTYECKEGVCSNNVCILESEICNNDFFDSYYESDKDKGGLCSLKYEQYSFIGEKCISDLDCNTGACNNNVCVLDVVSMCNNNKKDFYESDVDCGDLCEFYLDKSCSLNEKCNSNADCESNKCENNVCVENNVKIIPEYCFKDVFNNSFKNNDTNTTVFCGDECDFKCPLNVGCRNNFDCEVGLSCVNNTCIKEEIKEEKEKCEPSDYSSFCGGSCEPCGTGGICEKNSDCEEGSECILNPSGEKRCEKKSIIPKDVCFSDDNCDRGYRCDLETGSCVKKQSKFWMYFLIVLLLLIFSGSMFMLYLYYYKPEEFERIKKNFENTFNKSKTNMIGKNSSENKNYKNNNFDKKVLNENKSLSNVRSSKNISIIRRGEPLNSSFGINNVKNKPIVEKEKQERIKELIRKKRLEEKKKEREEYLKRLEESKLDKKEKK